MVGCSSICIGRFPTGGCNNLRRQKKGARALLLPSFAEGYGLPLAEALAQGSPVLCSDIPVFHEIGGGVPDYLDPTDGPAWRAAVLDYAQPQSPGRQAQVQRLGGWSQPTWAQHFARVDAALRALEP